MTNRELMYSHPFRLFVLFVYTSFRIMREEIRGPAAESAITHLRKKNGQVLVNAGEVWSA